MIEGKLWIDGREEPAEGGGRFPSAEPATGGVLAELARGTAGDVDRAVASAKKAQPAWAALDPNERARLLWRAGERLMERADDLARLEARDSGKPVANARLIDIPRAADTCFYFSGWATKLHGETIPVRGPFLNYTLREPLGVIGAITPWNFPILLAARKVIPALAVGNAVVLKPPEEAALTSIELAKILAEVGVPPGVCNVVTGLGEEAGAALVAHPDVAKITFTGSTEVGRIIGREAGSRLKKVSLELGGKSPNVIFADADVETAAKMAVQAAFYNQGELCTAGSRLLVQRSIRDQVVQTVVQQAQRMRVGDPLDESTQVGPLISAEHHSRVCGYIRRGEAEGAARLTGGAGEGPGFYVQPTVFDGVAPHMAIAREEIFGPVVSVLTFDDLEEAAALADATPYGLAAGVWTRDVGKAHALAARLQSGTVWINTYNRFDAASPYGGVKESGFGRENGRAVLDELTRIKSVWVALG